MKRMTWGQCKLIALQTMFSNEGADITVDDSNQDYVHAMPGKANEALQQLATVVRQMGITESTSQNTFRDSGQWTA